MATHDEDSEQDDGLAEPAESAESVEPTAPETGLVPSDPGYKRALVAALCAGLASFNAMYVTQGVLPGMGHDFHISPTMAALTVSATTGALALTVIPAGILSERAGRYRILQISVLAATILSLLIAFMPSIESVLILRALQGIAVAGVPAVIMTYLAEEIHAAHLPRVMGFYIAGTSLGGLIGRLIPGAMLEFTNWRGAVLASAIVSVLIGIATVILLPPSRNFTPKTVTVRHELGAFASHFRNPTLLGLFIMPFLMMGAFVSMYNYLGFHLTGTYGMPESLAAAIFIFYLSGTWSSARAGKAVQAYGQATVLTGGVVLALAGLLLMLVPNLWVTLAGALLFTAAFFACHSVASGWVGAAATHDRAEASSTYVLSYYLGSSVVGAVSGFFYDVSWLGLVGWLVGLFGVALVVTLFVAKSSGQRWMAPLT